MFTKQYDPRPRNSEHTIAMKIAIQEGQLGCIHGMYNIRTELISDVVHVKLSQIA